MEKYPELETAMVQITPANFLRYTNGTYFHPKHLVGGDSGSWLFEGICGAQLVEDTGLVAGFLHNAAGDWADCEVTDDLVAEDWRVLLLLLLLMLMKV